MSLEMSKEELRKATRAFRRKIAQVGLKHVDAVDARTAAVLKKNSILRRDWLYDEVESRLIGEIVADPSHPKRFPIRPGPAIVRVTTESSRTVVPVVVLLLAEDVEVRKAALAHFEHAGEGSNPWLTPKTIHVLSNCKRQLLLSNSKGWRTAGIRIHDAIRDDWLCNLQGLAQAAELHFNDGIQEYLSPVLRPTVTSLDSISMAVWSPGQERSKIDAMIADAVSSAETLTEALQRYYSKLGHLPLAGALGMGEVACRWAEKANAPECIWDEVWKWAEQTKGPLPRYHACVAMIDNPELVPSSSWTLLCDEVASIVHSSRREAEAIQEPPSAQAWRVRCELAKHYCQHLECRLPNADSERIAGLSWWLAERVALLLGSKEGIRDFRAGPLHYQSSVSAQVWHLARPRVSTSLLRHATIGINSMWGLSLACELRHALPSIAPESMTPECREQLEGALKAYVLSAFPLTPVVESSQAYAFEATVLPTAKGWIDIAQPGESRDALLAFVAAVERVTQADELQRVLERLPETGLADQVLIGNVLTVATYLGQASIDRIWERVVDAKWREAVLLRMDDHPLEMLFDALREIQLQQNDKWSWDMPHVYAHACEKAPNPERRRLLFAMAVLSSLSAGTVSAIERLLTGELRDQLANEVSYWREAIEEVWRLAPPLASSQMRAMLAVLPAVPPEIPSPVATDSETQSQSG
jgi:hypothetical protein